jgi:rhamnosyltransferase subunit B
MSRKVVLTWELGGGLGHAARLVAVSEALARRGFEPVLVARRPDSLEVLGFGATERDALKAPVWPGLIPGALPPVHGRQASLGDSLGDLGLTDASTIASLIGEWDRIFAGVKPNALVADFAPASLLAAAGRIPSVAIGSGYALPPATVPEFPLLRPDVSARKYQERVLLEAVNRALVASGRQELDRLPQIFAADRQCVACFEETDPYATLRDGPNLAPFLPPWSRAGADRGEEIFVYLPEHVASNPAVAIAIAQVVGAGKVVRIFVPDLDAAIAGRFVSAGALLETAPVPLDDLARRTSLVVYHGSLGIASFALAAGIPQIVIAHDTEKRLVGQAIERLGAGHSVALSSHSPLEGALLAQFVLETAADETLRTAVRSIAPEFVRRLGKAPAEEVAEEVAGLVG